ncbi:MAG: hypothetical protein ACXADF_16335 [Candidatus Thorarchaeota archaeon]|jgi:hypothetical protein
MLVDSTAGDSPFTAEAIRIMRSFERSKTWRVFRDALCKRREELFSEEETSTEQLWKNRGRILEVQWLIHNAGKLMLQYEMWRRAEAKAKPSSDDVTSDTGISEVPEGPATFTG